MTIKGVGYPENPYEQLLRENGWTYTVDLIHRVVQTHAGATNDTDMRQWIARHAEAYLAYMGSRLESI